MKIAFFDTHNFERPYYRELDASHMVVYFDVHLNEDSVLLAKGFDAVCCFVNDQISSKVLLALKELGVRLICLRCAGYNNVDLDVARELNIKVVRVPTYSPHAVAEHTVGLLLCLNRKIHKAYYRLKDLNFSLNGLVGFDLAGKTIGVIGCGKIGKVFVKIMNGFSCKVIVYDPVEDEDILAIARYTDLITLLKESDVISIHAPLNSSTAHIIDEKAFSYMKEDILLINTSRGGLIDSKALVDSLKKKKIGGAALDVYEEEEGVFFEDCSVKGLDDDTLARLLSFPNVLITSHQAFLTKEALKNIANTTLQSVNAFANNAELKNQV